MEGNNIVIVGAGEVGRTVATTLSNEGWNVYIVEKDPDKVKRISDEIDAEVITGNGSRPNVLAKAGIVPGSDIDILIACTDRDEVNMLSCWIARNAGVRKVISRTRSLEFTDRPDWGKKLGIDAMISPERSISREILRLIEVKGATTAAELLEGRAAMYSMKIAPSSPLCGLALKDIRPNFPELSAVFVYVEHDNGTSGVPNGNTILQENDICYIVARNNSVNILQQILQPQEFSAKTSRKIFIVGGGKLGTQIALTIKRRFGNVALRIIETDENKCKRLADEFGDALVINADGVDKRMLNEEGIEGADAYICATNSDEINMIYCAIASRMGAQKTIAIVKRSDYQSIASSIGVSSAVNTNISLSNVILQYVRYQEHALAYAMIDDINAEMLEVSLPENAPVTGKTLAQIKLAKGSVVALIARGENVIFPDGNTELKTGDNVILFALSEIMPSTAELFGASYHGH